jgi:hypothetical protein
MRGRLGLVFVVLLAVLAGWVVARSTGDPRPATRPVAQIADDDAGDQRATTTYDGPMVHRRAAIALHVSTGADRALIERRLRAQATARKIGGVSDATFAVFSPDLLKYLVPEMTVVLPEGATTRDAEVLMRDHTYPGVTFYLIENVLVHDLTFAVIPDGVTPGAARDTEDREGILSDSLGRYTTEVQRSGLTVRYFGAILSDTQVLTVRAAMGRAAHVPADRVAVEATSGGAGVDLSNGTPDLTDDLAGHHHG